MERKEREGRAERDGWIYLLEEGRGGLKRRKIECETDYDDHILNYVLHINKHHISFAVIFKAFPLCITE